MIKELAEIDIKPGHEAAFEAAVERALPFYLNSRGCLGFRLHRSMEQPTRYRILVEWETVEDHMIEFRNSDAFVEWRRIAAEYFRSPPRVEHLVVCVEGHAPPSMASRTAPASAMSQIA